MTKIKQIRERDNTVFYPRTHMAAVVDDNGTTVADVIPTLANSEAIAPEFSITESYAIGDVVMYQGLRYKFTAAHTAGAWNSAHVTQVDVQTDLEQTDEKIAELDAELYTYGTPVDITSEYIDTISNAVAATPNTDIRQNEYTIGQHLYLYQLEKGNRYTLKAIGTTGSAAKVQAAYIERSNFVVGGIIAQNDILITGQTSYTDNYIIIAKADCYILTAEAWSIKCEQSLSRIDSIVLDLNHKQESIDDIEDNIQELRGKLEQYTITEHTLTHGKSVRDGEIVGSGACDVITTIIPNGIKRIKAQCPYYSNLSVVGWRFLGAEDEILDYGSSKVAKQSDNGLFFDFDVPEGAVRFDNTIPYLEAYGLFPYEFDGVIILPSFNLEEIAKSLEVEIGIPSYIYAVVGDTLQIFYDSIFRCSDFRNYAIDVTCDIGNMYPRYYELTPNTGNIGNHTITFTIKGNNNVIYGTKKAIIKVVGVGASPSTNINILCVGASLTENGQWVSELKRRLTGTGGVPLGLEKTNISFVGRKQVSYQGISVKHEATGGYEFTSYTSTQGYLHKFFFTSEHLFGIATSGDVYSYNGHNFTIVEVNISGEIGNISCTSDVTSVYSSTGGTLTKVSGSGSSELSFANCYSTGNPFVYDGVVDMQQYADDYCNGSIDVIYTECFGNGQSIYADDLSTRLTQMHAFITQTLSFFPNCKFCIGLFACPDKKGGTGVNYHAKDKWHDTYGLKYSDINLCNSLQDYIDNHNLGDSVFIVNWLGEFDSENSYQQTTKAVNVRSNVTEVFGVNGVHPSDVGYYQMADTAFRLFVSKFCQ